MLSGTDTAFYATTSGVGASFVLSAAVGLLSLDKDDSAVGGYVTNAAYGFALTLVSNAVSLIVSLCDLATDESHLKSVVIVASILGVFGVLIVLGTVATARFRQLAGEDSLPHLVGASVSLGFVIIVLLVTTVVLAA